MKSFFIFFLLFVLSQASPPDGSFSAFGSANIYVDVNDENFLIVEEIPVIMINDRQIRHFAYHMEFINIHVVINDTGTYIWDSDLYYQNYTYTANYRDNFTGFGNCDSKIPTEIKFHSVHEIKIPRSFLTERYFLYYGKIIIFVEFNGYAIGIPDPKWFIVPETHNEPLDYCSLFENLDEYGQD